MRNIDVNGQDIKIIRDMLNDLISTRNVTMCLESIIN